jgi:hypothetical protein
VEKIGTEHEPPKLLGVRTIAGSSSP